MMIMLKIGIILDEDCEKPEYFDEIGEYLAKDIVGDLYNGDDYVDAQYLGSEKV